MSRRLLAGVIALGVVLLATTSCTSDANSSTAPTAASTPSSASSTAPSTPIAPTTPVFDAWKYQSDPQRVARITEAMQNFGKVVLQQDKVHGHWGPFDAYCSSRMENGNSTGGFTSKGYKPQPGEDCSVQHNPQYGGPAIQVIADFIVGPDGNFTNQIVMVAASTPACTAFVDFGDINKVATVGFGHYPNDKFSGQAKTLAEAQAIDQQAIDCLNNTRP